MGHRALVAYERTDGTYNLHYSHWGGCDLRLNHTITESTPFGGERPTEQSHKASTRAMQCGERAVHARGADGRWLLQVGLLSGPRHAERTDAESEDHVDDEEDDECGEQGA